MVKKRVAGKPSSTKLMGAEGRSSKLLPLALVIFVLAILFGASLFFSNIDLNGSSTEEERVELDHSLVKVLLKEGGTSSQELRVMNTGTGVESISVSSNLGGLLSVSDESFEISPGQTKVLTLEFVSSMDDVEYGPGVYSGYVILGGSDYSVELPIVLDIESEEVLFDSSLSFTKTEYSVGDSFNLPVRIYNLVSEEATNVLFEYTVKDLAGNLVYSGAETVLVDGQASLSNSVDISSSLNSGYYVVGVSVSYAGSVGVSSEVLEFVEESSEVTTEFGNFCGGSLVFCYLSGIILIVLLFFLGVFVVLFLKGFFKGKEENVSKIEKPGFGGSMSMYLLVGLLIFFVLLLIVFVSGLVSYPSFINAFSAIPLSVYILLFVLVVVFLIVVLYKDLQTVRTKSYYHEVERLKQSIEIEKYETKLEDIRAKKGKVVEKGWFAGWREGRARKKEGRARLESELYEHRVGLEKKKLAIKKKQEEDALNLKLKLEKQTLGKESKQEKGWFAKWREKRAKQKREKEKKKKEEKKLNLVADKKAEREKKKFEAALVHIKDLHREEKEKELKTGKLVSDLKKLETKPIVEEEVLAEPEKIQVALPVRKLPNLEGEVVDPWERTCKLLGFCYKALGKGELSKVEMYYSEMKPLFLQLNRKQKQDVYPKLVELQNDMTMAQMNSYREKLDRVKKKKR